MVHGETSSSTLDLAKALEPGRGWRLLRCPNIKVGAATPPYQIKVHGQFTVDQNWTYSVEVPPGIGSAASTLAFWVQRAQPTKAPGDWRSPRRCRVNANPFRVQLPLRIL